MTPKGLNKSELHWKPVDAFSLYGRQVEEGQDYFKLDWVQRAVDLDDLIAPRGHVLTGLSFRSLGGHLNLMIRATPIDIRTGKLRPEASRWIDNANTPGSENPR